MLRIMMKTAFVMVILTTSLFFSCDADKGIIKMSSEQTDNTAKTPSHDRSDHLETATFAAGCFWGVEATFRQLKGVTATAVGYTDGELKDPTYKDVCTNKTGHAEAVRVYYDPDEISYEKLVDVFFDSHNPTTLNRQGPDVGTQYRSAIFYHSEAQKIVAEAKKNILGVSGRFSNPVVTEIAPATTFYKAEEYHQQYLEKRGKSSCGI